MIKKQRSLNDHISLLIGIILPEYEKQSFDLKDEEYKNKKFIFQDND